MRGRVLIIDDEAEIRRNLTVGLTQEGFNTVACPHGISAIHELDSARDKGIVYDLTLLAEDFLAQESEKVGRKFKGFSEDFLEYLRSYSFPDNVQEFRTIIAGAVANAEGDVITLDSLPSYIKETIDREKAAVVDEFQPRRLDDVIREHVEKTFRYFGQQREKAAKELGISPEELDRLMADDKA